MRLMSTPPAMFASGPWKSWVWIISSPTIDPTAQASAACQLQPPEYQ
jgi:hypothetical protein